MVYHEVRLRTVADGKKTEEQKAYDKISLAFDISGDDPNSGNNLPLTAEQLAASKREFLLMGRAFRTLIDPERRDHYDKTGDDGVASWTPPRTRVQNSDFAWWAGLMAVALLTWYPVFVLNIGEEGRPRRKKKANQGGAAREARMHRDSPLDVWMAQLLNLNWVQQVYLSFLFFIVASMIIGSGPELNQLQKSYFKNLDRGIASLESEPVDYAHALQAFDAAMELEFGRRHVLPWLLSGRAYMELGERALCTEKLQQAFMMLPSSVNSALVRDRRGTERFMVQVQCA
jgi:hypothetical protein